ncbi:MAG TPA: CoA ester lyase [Jatrophihabitantaceae bacterium]
MTQLRSGPAWLFCPADRPDRYRKAADRADVVILDLEDAVAPQHRPAARDALAAATLEPDRVVVRINAIGTDDHAADLAAVRRTPFRTVMLAKSEGPEQVGALAELAVVALCETPRGVVNAAGLAALPNVVALMWGAEDLIAAMNGRSSRWPDGRYRDVARQARSTVLLAAAAHGVAAIDSVYTMIGDLDGLRLECDDAVASGFAHKACIHPDHAAVVRETFRPMPHEVDRARRVLAAMRGGGVAEVDGHMIDSPLIRQAEAVLRAAEEPS